MLRLGLLAAAILALAACGGDTPAAEPEPASPTAGAALEGETLAGGRLALADLRGTPVFVNVWASW
ncbi:MAG TPA: hypothetical protein VK915_02395 [Gaiellaceae bacterium]|nr:hypothetical protein [Gaiellaceae bacterium]